jgi:hypothetical protein
MWMAAPWRWTIGSLISLPLATNQIDYGPTIPGDFLFLHSVSLSDGITPPRDLEVEAAIPDNISVIGQPSRVAMAGNSLRVSPRPGNQPSVPPNIVALYKKSAPVITDANMATAGVQVFDDEWFWVFQEGVLWRAYMYGDDSRAGGATVTSDGRIQYTGQRAMFEAGLQFMKENEKLFLPNGKQDV